METCMLQRWILHVSFSCAAWFIRQENFPNDKYNKYHDDVFIARVHSTGFIS